MAEAYMLEVRPATVAAALVQARAAVDAVAWGPMPDADAVRGHPLYDEERGAPWMYRAGGNLGVTYLRAAGDWTYLREPLSARWHVTSPDDDATPGEWRPVDADGLPVARGGA